MRIFEGILSDLNFWMVVVFGALIKALLSEKHSLLRSIVSAISAIWLASIATEPTAHWLAARFELSYTDIRIPIAALYALTGDSLVRWIILKTNDGSFLSDLFSKLVRK